MTYNIVNKSKEILSNNGALLEDLTLDEAIAYKIENIQKSGEFDIVECPNANPKKERKGLDKGKKKSREELETEFIANLSPAQYSDLNRGVKALVFRGGSFGLKRVQEAQEAHVSVMEVKDRRESELKRKIKDYLKYRTEHFYEVIIQENGFEYEIEEFEQALNSLLKP